MADYDAGQALYAGLRGAGIGAAIGGGTGAIMYGGLRGYQLMASVHAAPANARTLLNSDVVVGEAIDPTRLARIKAAFERTGRVIDQSADAQAYLRLRDAGGLTFDARTVLLPEHPTTTAVFEEMIHTAQHRTGRFGQAIDQFGTSEAIRRMEIEAAEKLIRNRNVYQIPRAETRQTIERLRALRGQ